jgi:hypothetical protein
VRPTSYASRPTAELLLAAAGNAKLSDCYLGLLYAMDDVAVFGYVTASKLKIILAFALSDTMMKDADVTTVSMHTARALCLLTTGLDIQSHAQRLLSLSRQSFRQAESV